MEPFIGGGSVFVRINPANAVIGDVHKELTRRSVFMFYYNLVYVML